MKGFKVSVVMLAILLLFGSFTVCADETTVTTANEYVDIPIQKNGAIPAPADTVLSGRARIENSERMHTADIQSLMLSYEELLNQSVGQKVELAEDKRHTIEALKTCDRAYCTASYVYAVKADNDNGLTAEYLYYPDGRVLKVVSYDYNGTRYVAVNDNNTVIVKEGVSEITQPSSGTDINVYDVLFGMAIAVFVMLIVLVIVQTVKNRKK